MLNSFLPAGADETEIKDIIQSSGSNIIQAIQNTDNVNVFTDELKAKVENISEGSSALVYGIRWDSVNDIMVKGVLVNDIFVPTEYDIYPIQQQMKRGLLTTDGTFTPLHPTDSSKLEDGSTATLDGSAGQVMVQVPKFYMLTTYIGDYHYNTSGAWRLSFEWRGYGSLFSG